MLYKINQYSAEVCTPSCPLNEVFSLRQNEDGD